MLLMDAFKGAAAKTNARKISYKSMFREPWCEQLSNTLDHILYLSPIIPSTLNHLRIVVYYMKHHANTIISRLHKLASKLQRVVTHVLPDGDCFSNAASAHEDIVNVRELLSAVISGTHGPALVAAWKHYFPNTGAIPSALLC